MTGGRSQDAAAERSRRRAIGDIAMAAVLAVLVLGSLRFLGLRMPDAQPVDGWAAGLAITAAVAVALRRWPLVAFGMATIATSAYLVLGYPYGPILLCVAATGYAVARWVRLVPAVVAATVALPLLLLHAFVGGAIIDEVWRVLPGIALVVVPFCVGVTRRLVTEAATRRRADAERRVIDDERLRIASEVHDVVGHGLAAIQMQADIARHLRDRRPEQADIALDAISRASAEALAELRATLAKIAPDGGPDRDEQRAPTPGLHRLADLCGRMRDAGVDVDVEVSGERGLLPPAVDVAAYRIVQESLTNVAKHASERRASVRIRYGAGEVTIEIVGGRAPSGTIREGFGIAGMRRRARSVSGEVAIEADPVVRVIASLPV